MKTLTSLAFAFVILALSSSAFAETLSYNFTMNITSLEDGYGVFDYLSEGGTVDVSVEFDTAADGDGQALISIAGLDYQSAGHWGGSWSSVQYNAWDKNWGAQTGTNGQYLIVNDIQVSSGTLSQEVFLDFETTSSGELALVGGTLNLRLENGSRSSLSAEYAPPPPTSVPELDPNSGMAALVLVGGGLTIAWSRRRREGGLLAS